MSIIERQKARPFEGITIDDNARRYLAPQRRIGGNNFRLCLAFFGGTRGNKATGGNTAIIRTTVARRRVEEGGMINN